MSRVWRSIVAAIALSSAGVAAPVAMHAQTLQPADTSTLRRRAGPQQPNTPAAQRQALEGRVRQALAGVVRKQLGLNDEQMQKLQRVDQKYDQERRAMLRGERQARQALRVAMQDSTPDQAKIAHDMDDLVAAQHRRADILGNEQKELSGFLTPLQRAKYQALRERLTRTLQNVQRGGAGARRGPAGRGARPRGPG
jgi:Spy/CpxP family protein refolding chaperone